ncbi:MAG: hypothetical protein JSV36_22500 [Anaerolineae bacterium]|nr:MAG: hypothetical protein JSV36_22500 [Anaerolineae bacterium]
MKKRLLLALSLVLILGPMPGLASGPTTRNYGNFTLSGGFQSGHFSESWDLTAGDLILRFTYDATGLVDSVDTDGDGWQDGHAWGELGVRSPCYGDFNPSPWDEVGVWLVTDYHWATNALDPDPSGAPIQDLDDKLILMRGCGHDEGNYNLPSTPPNPCANHAVWFDRDGVDPVQAPLWGSIDGVTYNTGGTYEIVITLHATSDTTGEAYMAIHGQSQGFYDPSWHPGPADLMPAGMTFGGDMKHLQVFYGLYGYGATHTIAFNDVTVEGYLGQSPAPCEEALMAEFDIWLGDRD